MENIASVSESSNENTTSISVSSCEEDSSHKKYHHSKHGVHN